MNQFRGLQLWISVWLLLHIWGMEMGSVINAQTTATRIKPRFVPSPAIAESLRSDMKRMQNSLDKMVEGLAKLETLCAQRIDERMTILVKDSTTPKPQIEHSPTEKTNNQPNDTAAFNAVDTVMKNDIDLELLRERVERMSKIQERNSRLLTVQMTSLTNLEESFGRLENLYRSTTLSAKDGNSIKNSSLNNYQLRVINLLIAIDKKLDRLPTTATHPDLAIKKNGDDEKNDSDDGNDNSGTKDKDSDIDERPNVTMPAEDSLKIEKPSGEEDPDIINSTVLDCESLRNSGSRSGIYRFDRTFKVKKMILGNASLVYCDLSTDGGGWTVVQRRGGPPERRVNFTRSWDDYANGFGDLDGEFWFGNEIVHRMTRYLGQYELRIDLEDWNGETAWAQYSQFEIDSIDDEYRIKVSGYTGNATDSLSAHDSTPFSTFDRRNDLAPRCCPCTSDYGGGWWFYSCFEANLNGDYYERDQYRETFRGIIWEHWRGDYSLKSTKMMIRSTYRNSINQS